jgi:hypothetical protein
VTRKAASAASRDPDLAIEHPPNSCKAGYTV